MSTDSGTGVGSAYGGRGLGALICHQILDSIFPFLDFNSRSFVRHCGWPHGVLPLAVSGCLPVPRHDTTINTFLRGPRVSFPFYSSLSFPRYTLAYLHLFSNVDQQIPPPLHFCFQQQNCTLYFMQIGLLLSLLLQFFPSTCVLLGWRRLDVAELPINISPPRRSLRSMLARFLASILLTKTVGTFVILSPKCYASTETIGTFSVLFTKSCALMETVETSASLILQRCTPNEHYRYSRFSFSFARPEWHPSSFSCIRSNGGSSRLSPNPSSEARASRVTNVCFFPSTRVLNQRIPFEHVILLLPATLFWSPPSHILLIQNSITLLPNMAGRLFRNVTGAYPEQSIWILPSVPYTTQILYNLDWMTKYLHNRVSSKEINMVRM